MVCEACGSTEWDNIGDEVQCANCGRTPEAAYGLEDIRAFWDNER